MNSNYIDLVIENHLTLNTLNSSITEEFDPYEYFKTENTYIEEVYNEASDTNKKNIIQKLWAMIKKAAVWIGKKIMHIIRGIKRMTVGNKLTPNQILGQIGVKRHKTVRDHVNVDDTNKAIDAANNAHLNLIEGFKEDGILINPSALVAMSVNEAPVKGKNINGGGSRADQVIELILNPSPIDEYINFFKELTSDLSKTPITSKDIDKVNKKCKEFSGRPSIASYTSDYLGNTTKKEYNHIYIHFSQLIEFQRKVDEMCEVGEAFDNVFNKLNVDESVASEKKDYMKIMNELSWAVVNLQGGLHAISNGLQGVYNIDPGYYESINDPEVLAQFVSESLKYGGPNKYLVRNIYNVCDPVLKGNPDLDKPIMGFGRLTLIPDGDIIYKVAINRYGIRSNKNDFAVMNVVKETPLMDKFAETTKTIGDYIINVMEKVKAGSANEPSAAEASRLGKEINNELDKMGINFEIHDIKSDAFGKKGDNYVLLDYGYLHRRGYDAQQPINAQ